MKEKQINMIWLKIRAMGSAEKRTGQLISVFLPLCHFHLLRALRLAGIKFMLIGWILEEYSEVRWLNKKFFHLFFCFCKCHWVGSLWVKILFMRGCNLGWNNEKSVINFSLLLLNCLYESGLMGQCSEQARTMRAVWDCTWSVSSLFPWNQRPDQKDSNANI